MSRDQIQNDSAFMAIAHSNEMARVHLMTVYSTKVETLLETGVLIKKGRAAIY